MESTNERIEGNHWDPQRQTENTEPKQNNHTQTHNAPVSPFVGLVLTIATTIIIVFTAIIFVLGFFFN